MNMKIKTILVDDELHSLENMRWLLDEYCPEVEIVQTFDSPVAALHQLPLLTFDLLLLDVAMPVLNGFDLLSQLLPASFSVIFITAHNGSVLRAIKQAGLPYLLKPVDDEELRAMIHKVTQQPQRIEMECVQALKNQLTEYRW